MATKYISYKHNDKPLIELQLNGRTVWNNSPHSWGEWEEVTPPQCEVEGMEQRKCAICGETETRTIPALGHDWLYLGKIEPNCVDAGLIEYTCVLCGAYKTEIDPDAPADPTTHDWGEWKVIHPAECEVPGMKERKCAICGEAETEIIPALGHNYDSGGRIIEPTCTTGGYILHTCVDCGHTYKDNFTEPNDAHTEGEWVVDIAPTGTREGVRSKYCTECGVLLDTENLRASYAQPYTYFVFSNHRDGHHYQVSANSEYVENLSGYITLPIRDGAKAGTGTLVTAVAERGFVECENITALYIPANYALIDDDAFAYCTNLRKVVFDSECEISIIGRGAFANCTSLTECKLPSKTKYVHEDAFSGCPNLARVEVPISVETMESRVFASAPNLTVYCEAESKPEAWADDWVDDTVTVVWGHTISEDCTEGHDWDVEVTVVEPTCSEQGYTIHTCNRCGEVLHDNYTDPTNLHNWGDWTIDIEPTCTGVGSKTCTCRDCGQLESQSIPMVAHTPGDWIIDKEPTTEEEGSKHQECTECGYIFPTLTIPKLESEDATYLTDESGNILTDENGNLLTI